MMLHDGRILLDSLDHDRIEYLTGEAPESGMPPSALKHTIDRALARRRAEEPDKKLVWGLLERCFKDIDRLAQTG